MLCCAVAVAGCSRALGPSVLPAGAAYDAFPWARVSAAAPKVLHVFGGGADGFYPVARLIAVNGVLYGTTPFGGTAGRGTVFSVTTAGKERVVYNFLGGPDGSYPLANLVVANGVLYGTTQNGGTYAKGTVFSVTTNGVERVLYSFGNKKDGAAPSAGLIVVKGLLYGTTPAGGTKNKGVAYSVTTAGTERVLYNFGTQKKDGSQPQASLTNLSGTLYGTTYAGGKKGKGTVFSVTTSGAEKVLYSFTGGADGGNPYANLTNALHSFGSGADGAAPYAGLIVVSGKLYGTTVNGGQHGAGTVFRITTSGTEKVLVSYGGAAKNAAYPWASLTAFKSLLYGTTRQGGNSSGFGTVISLKP
jgi:uncharacterized repeat protein (TIGR03803 family)